MVTTRQFKLASWTLNGWGKLYVPDNIIGKMPLVVFCHGAGETGTTQASTSKLETNGPLYFIKNGWKPNFMVLAVQDASWSFRPSAIDYVLKNDSEILDKWNGKDCLITGLSAGGEFTVTFMDTPAYDKSTFAYVPMSPAGNATLKNPTVPHRTWFFSGNADGNFTETAKALTAITKGRITIYPGGHGGWNKFYDPNYREDGKNIYEFAFDAAAVPNQPPVSMAGPDQAVKLSAGATETSVILTGKGLDNDGTIANYKWREAQRETANPPSIIVSPFSATTEVKGLKEGKYIFNLDATDNDGAQATDDVVIEILKADIPDNPVRKLIISDESGVIFQSDITSDINISL
jgi:K319L-like, PKD domain